MNLQELIDQKLLKISEERKNRERSGKYNPSQFGCCFRKQFLNRKNAPSNAFGLDTLHMFEAGTLIHEYIQQYFENKTCEVEIDEDHYKGYADIVTSNCVIDIKSTNPNYFFGMMQYKPTREFKWFTPDEIDKNILIKKRHNCLQAAFYAYKLGKPLFSLVFFSRDLSYGIKAHQWTAKLEDWKEELENELVQLENYWLQDKLPPALPRLYDGKECKYCNYYGVSCEGKE